MSVHQQPGRWVYRLCAQQKSIILLLVASLPNTAPTSIPRSKASFSKLDGGWGGGTDPTKAVLPVDLHFAKVEASCCAMAIARARRL
eukprot:958380-Rhodomonas_salina.2